MRGIRRSGVVVSTLLLVAICVPGAAAAVGDATTGDPAIDDRSAFVIVLDEDGDATVSLTLTYDLSDANDEAAFTDLREQPDSITEPFAERLSRVAERTATDANREMSVTNVRTTVTTRDEVGIIRLSASWGNLASAEGDRLIVDEPFASEFRPDRPFVLVTPEGYVVTETTVPTDGTNGTVAEWGPDTDLSGFSATIASDDAAATSTVTDPAADVEDSVPTPFGVPIAVVLTLLCGYAGWRRA